MAQKSTIIFLILGSRLNVSKVNLVLNDFIGFYLEEKEIVKKLKAKDYREINRIRRNLYRVKETYLFKLIKPFFLPFYEEV